MTNTPATLLIAVHSTIVDTRLPAAGEISQSRPGAALLLVAAVVVAAAVEVTMRRARQRRERAAEVVADVITVGLSGRILRAPIERRKRDDHPQPVHLAGCGARAHP
ncbi:MAG: hypothetical protein ACRDXX_12980 [Stackebrandtia sp.]